MRHNVKCKSGLRGWQGRLHEVYIDFMQFEEFCAIYQIHARLGFGDVRACWQANPIVRGSVNPSDLQLVKPKRKGRRCSISTSKNMRWTGVCRNLATHKVLSYGQEPFLVCRKHLQSFKRQYRTKPIK